MDTKIQMFQENTGASFVTLHLLNGCNGGKKLEGVFNKSNLNLGSNNEITELDVFHIQKDLFLKLKQINLSGCKLTEIPNTVFSFKYLVALDLSNNFLNSLPKEIGNLHNLLTLKVPGNKLTNLPKTLKNIQQLNYLDLSCNNIFEVPEVLYYGLRGLKVLNLSSNNLMNFNDPPACLDKLIELRLSSNMLTQLPLWIFDNLCQLQIFDVSENQLRLGVDVVCYCTTGIFESLQLLNIENSNCNCDNMQVFSHCRHLKTLQCGNRENFMHSLGGKNYFGNFNMEVFKSFQGIKQLHLQNVEISTLPADFDSFKKIESLDLSNNALSWLPESFCNLTTLKILNLMSNQLLFLPSNIGELVSLQEIHVSNNKLYGIPESFYDLFNLQFIDFYNNEIEKINVNIFRLKNLKGLDLGLNCSEFFCGDDKISLLYNNLKDFFRKHFSYTDSRSDLQKKIVDSKKRSNSQSDSYKSSICSLESQELNFSEVLTQHEQQSNVEDENWESEVWDNTNASAGEDDELFDPNEMDDFQPPKKSWKSNFQNNFCPAKYHAPSLLKTYIKNFKEALENKAEEGQFDSD